MTQRRALWVNRADLGETKLMTDEVAPEAGEILLAVDKFALTANNVSYAVTGDSLGYWGFYPAEDGWGQVPVWGFGDVVASNAPEIPVGERLYGYFTMASHVLLRPGPRRGAQVADASPHRAQLPALYNAYAITTGASEQERSFEDARCLYFPLFMTSYLLCDFAIDNAMFGASQAIIGSASSKTGFGLASFLSEQKDRPKIFGVTSAGNAAFVKGLGCYDEVILYDEVERIDAGAPSFYVDMSGNGALTTALHERLGENMKASIMVGATHWSAERPSKTLPGAPPTFFFAPSQMSKRDKEWGPGVLLRQGLEASVRLSGALSDTIEFVRLAGPDEIARNWRALLGNEVPPNRGLIASLL